MTNEQTAAWARRADASASHLARVFADLYLDGHIGLTEAVVFLTQSDDKRNAPSNNNKTALEQFKELTHP